MAFIDIHTNNLSRELKNATTYIDNWAYVPGTARTGDYKIVHFITSLDQFYDLFGTKGCEGSLTHTYVSGLLNAGIPVLFRRIACVNQDQGNETPGVVSASTTFTHEDAETSSTITDMTVYEKYGGTFGNDMSVIVNYSNGAYWIDVYVKHSLIERKKILSVTAELLNNNIKLNEKLIQALRNTTFNRIKIDIEDTMTAAKFNLETGKEHKLSGGQDFDEKLVAAEIPGSYNYIKDKILYQPKFITSGGYVDIYPENETPIADAMLQLTKERQDCRAIIDLPLVTTRDEYQDLATNIAYQQLSDSQPIPSGMICAPWQYMQVGNNQEWMPPSYAYLTVVGSSLSKGEPVYKPKAGLSAGQVANVIKPQFEIGSDILDRWQSDTKVNINPIMKLQGSRYIIAGNSTLLMPDGEYGETNAFLESSADLAVIEIRRYMYNLANQLQYQYNSVEAFETFALNASNFLDKMISEGAVTDYNIYNISTDADPRTLKIRLDVSVSPTIKNIEIYLNVSYGSIEMSTGGEA